MSGNREQARHWWMGVRLSDMPPTDDQARRMTVIAHTEALDPRHPVTQAGFGPRPVDPRALYCLRHALDQIRRCLEAKAKGTARVAFPPYAWVEPIGDMDMPDDVDDDMSVVFDLRDHGEALFNDIIHQPAYCAGLARSLEAMGMLIDEGLARIGFDPRMGAAREGNDHDGHR